MIITQTKDSGRDDEGLNTFVQSLTQREYYSDGPLRRGTAESIVNYMRMPKDMLRPIMTNSEQIAGRERARYAKPAAALSVLRETIMGPELLIMLLKNIPEDGHLNTLTQLISLELWRTLAQ